MFEEKLRQRITEYLDRPYQCENRHMACVLLVLEIMAPYSQEIRQAQERLLSLDIGRNKRELIRQDYFSKFIRTTRLKPVALPDLSCGDILLINEYSRERVIDHLGLYLGQGKYLHLKREKNKGDLVEIVDLDETRHKILSAVRGRID